MMNASGQSSVPPTTSLLPDQAAQPGNDPSRPNLLTPSIVRMIIKRSLPSPISTANIDSTGGIDNAVSWAVGISDIVGTYGYQWSCVALSPPR